VSGVTGLSATLDLVVTAQAALAPLGDIRIDTSGNTPALSLSGGSVVLSSPYNGITGSPYQRNTVNGDNYLMIGLTMEDGVVSNRSGSTLSVNALALPSTGTVTIGAYVNGELRAQATSYATYNYVFTDSTKGQMHYFRKVSFPLRAGETNPQVILRVLRVPGPNKVFISDPVTRSDAAPISIINGASGDLDERFIMVDQGFMSNQYLIYVTTG